MSDELRQQLVMFLQAGNYLDVAARTVGIPAEQLEAWLERGLSDSPEDEAYARLRVEVDRARAQGEARNVARVQQAATETWQAAAWLLERQYPERWARPAVRAEEPPAIAPDALDELAEKRAARRARR